MLRRLLVVPFVLLALTSVAAAQSLDLPGLSKDAPIWIVASPHSGA